MTEGPPRPPRSADPDLRVAAGAPDDVELAAVVAALEALGAVELGSSPATEGAGRADGSPPVPAWQRAALHEATGGDRVHAPADLRAATPGARPT